MSRSISSRTGGARGCRTALAGVALVSGALLFAASPAQARNDFKNGFQDQLGRIAAFEVVRAGKYVLFGGYAPYYAPHWRFRPVVHRTRYAPPRRVVRHPHVVRHHHVAPPYEEPCAETRGEPLGERIVYERYERQVRGFSLPYRDDFFERRTRY